VRQRRDDVGNVAADNAVARTDLLGCDERTAAHEDRQTLKNRPFPLRKEIVTPGDRRLHGFLARRHVARIAVERESVTEARAQGVRPKAAARAAASSIANGMPSSCRQMPTMCSTSESPNVNELSAFDARWMKSSGPA